MFTIRSLVLILTASILAGCLPANYKTLPIEQHTYAKVYESSLNKDKLFLSLHEWVARNLGDSNKALRINNSATGTLLAKMIIPNGMKDSLGVRHALRITLRLEAKDGKYRYTASDFEMYYDGSGRPASIGSEYDSSYSRVKALGGEINASLTTFEDF